MFKNFIKKLIKARQEQANRRIAVMQLSALTDKELHDIGVNRCDIKRVAYGSKSDREATGIS